MIELWFPMLAKILIGWPGIIGSLVLSIVGVATKRKEFLWFGAVLAIPISWYLGGTPRFRYVIYLVPLFQAGAAIAVQKQKIWLGGLLILPFAVLAAWLAFMVLSQ